jgi:hypothetical protein
MSDLERTLEDLNGPFPSDWIKRRSTWAHATSHAKCLGVSSVLRIALSRKQMIRYAARLRSKECMANSEKGE